MIVYLGTKKDFLDDAVNDRVASKVKSLIYEKMHRATQKEEYDSFVSTTQYMYKVLSDESIPDNAGIAMEYNVPLTSKRIDFIISGRKDSEILSAIIIELKQWQKAELVEGTDGLVETYTGGALRDVVHPSYQAWSYAQMISAYNENVYSYNIVLSPCAYLHNYVIKNNDPIENSIYKEYIEYAPLFYNGDAIKLRDFIKRHIKIGDNAFVIDLIDKGKIKPSRSLQDSLSSMIKGNKEFILLDSQKEVYEKALYLAGKSKDDYEKRVLICKGGPGTGKTVIGINLLVELTKRNQVVQYVTKNQAVRDVFKKKLKGAAKEKNIDMMFKGSGCFADTPSKFFDTLIVDEAHRLNAKSGIYHNYGENQIKEIINSSKFSIFFIDEDQRVTTEDIGSIEEIKKWASYFNAEIFERELLSQFRCNGSDGYLAFLDNILEIRETANYNFEGFDYDFKVFDNPESLKKAIVEKNTENKARLVAGYCWNWPKSTQNDSNYNDIKIGNFGMPWNLKTGETFAIDPSSINKVGCIHTCQGLEFDYVGVIIGDDLRYENNCIITDFTKRASTDQSIKGLKSLYIKDRKQALARADSIIKNTYKVLMSRGLKGCYIYCTNQSLNNRFKKIINDIS